MNTTSEKTLGSAMTIPRRFTPRFWIILGIILATGNFLIWLNHPLTYGASWGAAQQAVMGRSFAQHGVIALKGIPIQNNSPLGKEPDAYVHWPPLPPIVLGLCFRLFGESEAVNHLLMFSLFLANIAAIFLLAKIVWGESVAVWSALITAVIPVNIAFAHVNTPQHWANLCIVGTIIGYFQATRADSQNKKWMLLAGIFLFAGVLLSWEPFLLPPVLLVVAIFQHQQKAIRLALVLVGVSMAGLGIMAVQLIFGAPEFATDLWQTALMRMNFHSFQRQDLNVHTLVNQSHYSDHQDGSGAKLLEQTPFAQIKSLKHLGVFPLVAMIWLTAQGTARRQGWRDHPHLMIFAGLAGPWLLWYLLMSNQAKHNFMILLAVPIASIAGGLALRRLMEIANTKLLRFMVYALIPLSLLFPVANSLRARSRNPAQFEDWAVPFGHDITTNTETNAIVLTPLANFIPVYYTQRHLIRGIAVPSLCEQVLRQMPTIFPKSPVYLALRPDGLEGFGAYLTSKFPIKRTPNLILIQLSP